MRRLIVIIKILAKKIILSMKFFHRPAVVYCTNYGLLPEIFVWTPASKLRSILLLPQSSHVTQLNQDVFALLVNQFKPGFFVEIGANDGFTLSNTVYLEDEFEWVGLLVEANPQYIDSLKNRKSHSIIAAVVEQEGYYEFRSAGLYGGIAGRLDNTYEDITRNSDSISVWGTTLEKILEENNAPELINFISIDVEGAEVPIVEQMCSLKKYRFLCGCIEFNARQEDYEKISNLLKQSGYQIVWERQTRHDLFFVDEERIASIG